MEGLGSRRQQFSKPAPPGALMPEPRWPPASFPEGKGAWGGLLPGGARRDPRARPEEPPPLSPPPAATLLPLRQAPPLKGSARRRSPRRASCARTGLRPDSPPQGCRVDPGAQSAAQGAWPIRQRFGPGALPIGRDGEGSASSASRLAVGPASAGPKAGSDGGPVPSWRLALRVRGISSAVGAASVPGGGGGGGGEEGAAPGYSGCGARAQKRL